MMRARANHARELMAQGREELVAVMRDGYRAGMTQRHIAQATGTSQAEVNRLLRFHGTSPHAVALRKALPEVKTILKENGLSRPRIFGSTARGEDGKDSDIDLLVTASKPLGMLTQARIEAHLSDCIGVPVDLVIDSALRKDLAPRINAEAIPL